MRGYFEGWYFKMVTADESETVVLIPGVSFEREGHDAHAFIQFAQASRPGARYFRYGIDDFSSASDCFYINVGASVFERDGFTIDARDESGYVVGKLKFSNHHPWPMRPLSPGAMGPFAFVPFMQCYHGVISFDHSISGSLQIDGRTIDFEGGRGYMEKDWGKSFPLYHIWLQSNHFDTPESSIMLSIGNVPWLGCSFNGFIAGLLVAGRLYRFATYTGARLDHVRLEPNYLQIGVSSPEYSLELTISNRGGITLKSPLSGEMRGELQESLSALVHVRLTRHGTVPEVLYEDTGRNCGLEIAASPAEISALVR